MAGLQAAKEDEVTSPTFTLLHEYGTGGKVFHGDLYRVESFHDFETLGMEDVFAKPAFVILEWSEKFPLKTEWPQIRVRLEHLGGDALTLILTPLNVGVIPVTRNQEELMSEEIGIGWNAGGNSHAENLSSIIDIEPLQQL